MERWFGDVMVAREFVLLNGGGRALSGRVVNMVGTG
jgi:hypothetical protein